MTKFARWPRKILKGGLMVGVNYSDNYGIYFFAYCPIMSQTLKKNLFDFLKICLTIKFLHFKIIIKILLKFCF